MILNINPTEVYNWAGNCKHFNFTHKRYKRTCGDMILTRLFPKGIDEFGLLVFKAVHGEEINALLEKAWSETDGIE